MLCALSVITYRELLYGATKSAQRITNGNFAAYRA